MEAADAAQEPSDKAGARFPGALGGALVAEFIGTFFFVFFGAATIVLFAKTATKAHVPALVAEPMFGDVAIGLAFGFGIVIAVYAFLNVSGAHVNPAVTLALALVRKFPWKPVVPYWIAQMAGGFCAGLAIQALYAPGAASSTIILGATHPPPGVSDGMALLSECILTFTLMIVIMATAVDKRSTPSGAALAIGFVIAAGIFAMYGVSGGSFNPARTIPLMVVAMAFPAWWVYVVGPFAGAAAGAFAYHYLVHPGRKPPPPDGSGEGGQPD